MLGGESSLKVNPKGGEWGYSRRSAKAKLRKPFMYPVFILLYVLYFYTTLCIHNTPGPGYHLHGGIMYWDCLSVRPLNSCECNIYSFRIEKTVEPVEKGQRSRSR